MKTIELTVYRFSELSEKAKQRAKDHYAESFGYNWSDDALKSLTALAEHFGGRVGDYAIDWFDCTPSRASFDMPELEPAYSSDASFGTERWEQAKESAKTELAKIFGGRIPLGVYLNSDPRGHMLKLDCDEKPVPDGMQRDWGGNGILAAEINEED